MNAISSFNRSTHGALKTA